MRVEGTSAVGVVVIGRNEGDRLNACLASVAGATRVVYVDSGSSDGSPVMARAMGADVVELDGRVPFTAARARNEGFTRARALAPGLDYVQFVDGDCEIAGSWLERAVAFLDEHPAVAALCGRLRERYPERSIYNKLCDMEWDAPAGEVRACGGNAMVRVAPFAAAGGFRADLIAGEEPELCVRMRASRWRIWRIGEEMALHDAAMLRFGQWWKRAVRTGHAFAQGAALHGAPPERHGVRESRSAWFWGVGIPAVTLGGALWWGPWSLTLLLIYPLQVVRLALHGTRTARDNWWRAVFLVLGKFPEVIGQMQFLAHRFLGRQARLIEYK